MFGTNDNPQNKHLSDLTKNEYWQLVPLAILIIWIGVAPRTLMDLSEQSIRAVVSKVEHFNAH